MTCWTRLRRLRPSDNHHLVDILKILSSADSIRDWCRIYSATDSGLFILP